VRVLRNFLRPGWIALAVVVIAFAVACFWVLAPWQLGKNSRTEHQNDLIKRAESSQPVPIGDLYVDGRPVEDAEWSQVLVTGTYLPDKQAVVRLRSIDGAPAYEVLTPIVDTTGATYLVNRGYVNPVQGTALPPIAAPPSGEVTIEARIRAAEGTSPGREPRTEAGALQVYSIDSAVLSSVIDVPLAAGYLQLTDDQPGGLGVIDLPQLDSGPYLSYGLQWLAFGVMAPLGLGYFVWSEVKQRRAANSGTPTPKKPRERGRQTREALAASSTGGVGSGKVRGTVGSGPAAGTPDDKLSDRYGR
jgi:cytochrome oxidase assembly protein ShyY1